jgi:hypothetical protein
MYQKSAKAQKKKEQRAAATQATPYGTLAAVREFLGKFSPPERSFDPHGAWKHGYEIHLNSSAAPVGYLEIAREGSALSVESAVIQSTGAMQQTKARIICAQDALATPRSWQLESVLLDSAGQPVADTRLAHTATVTGGAIEAQIGKHKRTSKVSPPFTSNWSLFDAAQRLPGKGMSPLRFALIEDLDLLKGNQRLSFAEKTEVSVAGGRQLALTGYERIGEGVLPYHYWVDDQHRLLFVLSGPRAYLYNPEARSAIQAGRRPRKRG